MEWVQLWELTPPADDAAGGVTHSCMVSFDVGGFNDETPPLGYIRWVSQWGERQVCTTPPAVIMLGGVKAVWGGMACVAGGAIRGLPPAHTTLWEGFEEVWGLQQLRCKSPPATDVAGGEERMNTDA